MRVAIVSTYPPRACGIGTFSRDLREALEQTDAVEGVDVVAIVRDPHAEQAAEVVARIVQDQRGDYAAAARVLNRRPTDVVVLEHEFGIFGGPDGGHVVSFARELRVPTLHTVLSAPSPRQAETLRELCALASLVTVFTETARRMVVEARLFVPERVRVVPHGAPALLARDGDGDRGAHPDHGRRILATFGLISSGKGIETAIAAMPEIARRHPDALYVIAGQTHPEVVAREGEQYRLSLERLARDLELDDHVVFDDRFLTVEDLGSMLHDTTIYLTPYRSREQIVSGALTFAIAAGCPTVSTPYFYAEDLLGSGAGVLVPFDDPGALADAVNGLLDAPQRLEHAQRMARALGRQLAWPSVGRRATEVLREAVALGPHADPSRPRAATLPRARTSHLMTLVDDVGIVQHADGVVPARASGYCVDDVARLAIVALGLRRTTGDEAYNRTLALSLGFLRHAAGEAGAAADGMHNFLSYDRRWLDAPHRGDHVGRTAWALGEVVAAEPTPAVVEPSRRLLGELLGAVRDERSPRTIAFALLGLAHAGPDRIGGDAEDFLRALAQRLAARQRANATPDWLWAEDVLAYDDARLPQALIAAGARLGDDAMVRSGLDALRWYGDELGADGPFVRHVGHATRRRGEPAPGAGDEQPINAAALVEAEVEAYVVTGEDAHADRAVRAFEWFLGRNRLATPVYDFATGGCHDGLGEEVVNANEGAESTLAYLQALLALDVAGLQANVPEQA